MVQRGRKIGKPVLTAPALHVVFCYQLNALRRTTCSPAAPSPFPLAAPVRAGKFVSWTAPGRPCPDRDLLRSAAVGTILAEPSAAGRVSRLRAPSPLARPS